MSVATGVLVAAVSVTALARTSAQATSAGGNVYIDHWPGNVTLQYVQVHQDGSQTSIGGLEKQANPPPMPVSAIVNQVWAANAYNAKPGGSQPQLCDVVQAKIEALGDRYINCDAAPAGDLQVSQPEPGRLDLRYIVDHNHVRFVDNNHPTDPEYYGSFSVQLDVHLTVSGDAFDAYLPTDDPGYRGAPVQLVGPATATVTNAALHTDAVAGGNDGDADDQFNGQSADETAKLQTTIGDLNTTLHDAAGQLWSALHLPDRNGRFGVQMVATAPSPSDPGSLAISFVQDDPGSVPASCTVVAVTAGFQATCDRNQPADINNLHLEINRTGVWSSPGMWPIPESDLHGSYWSPADPAGNPQMTMQPTLIGNGTIQVQLRVCSYTYWGKACTAATPFSVEGQQPWPTGGGAGDVTQYPTVNHHRPAEQ
jgi:hypothetical protein